MPDYFSNTFKSILQAEILSITGRAYMREEVLTQIWLKFIKLLDNPMNAQKESLKKYFQGSCKLPQAHEKVCDEYERNKEKMIGT